MPNMHVPQEPRAPSLQPKPAKAPTAAADAADPPGRQQPMASPAMCAMHLMPVADRRAEFEQWLQTGRTVLSKLLEEHRVPSSVPSSRLLIGNSLNDPNPSYKGGSLTASTIASEASFVERCFHWIHVPSPDSHQPDLVAILFTRSDDLALWRSSTERTGWLASGDHLARKQKANTSLAGAAKNERGGAAASIAAAVAAAAGANGDRAAAAAAANASAAVRDGAPSASSANSLIRASHSFSFTRDDGSLGGWMPAADSDGSSAGKHGEAAAPAVWKVSATVLVAMYPMQELNRLVLMPGLDALSPEVWGSLAPSAQLFVACGFAAGGTTFVLLPHARRFTEAIGLLPTSGGAGSRAKMPPPPLSKSAPPLLLAYLLLIGAGVAASSLATASAPWHVERLGKLTPPHRWGVEVARCEGTKA